MSSICCRVTSPDRAAFVVCTCGDSPCTVICSDMPPTSSAIVRSPRRSVAPSAMPFCSYVLNPVILTVRSYVPASRSGNRNEPSAPVTVSRTWLVPAFLSTTETPGMTPPPASVTVPDN
jgi:hypothetical protein